MNNSNKMTIALLTFTTNGYKAHKWLGPEFRRSSNFYCTIKIHRW